MRISSGKHLFTSKFPRRAFVLPVLVLVLFAGCATAPWDIQNPYATVNWAEDGQYKANLHTHTTRSDGRLHPHMVVDEYHALGYSILAITDHNEVTYPWTAFSELKLSERSLERMKEEPETMPETAEYEDRDPAALGMIDIQGNELSSHHHMNSLFNDHNGTKTEEESLKATAAKNGITFFNHPGRYDKPVEWYLDFYHRYDHLAGLEVYNSGDRYPHDRELWDAILEKTMPDRPVWGYSNDDMHTLLSLGRNWSMFVLPELSHEWVRRGMEQGLSYFIYAPRGHRGAAPPVIEAIRVTPEKGLIEIEAAGYESIEWICKGETVHEGKKVNLNKLDGADTYIRAVLHGADRTVACTQPFGIRKP